MKLLILANDTGRSTGMNALKLSKQILMTFSRKKWIGGGTPPIFLPDKGEPRFVLMTGGGRAKKSPKWAPGRIDRIQRSKGDSIHKFGAFWAVVSRYNVRLFSGVYNPEPGVEHFTALFRLVQCLANKSPSLIAVASLHGAGASAPQLFHVHLRPVEYGQYGKDKLPVPLGKLLLANTEHKSSASCSVKGVEVYEITGPIWGIKIKFPEKLPRSEMARLFHRSIHRGVRYRSYLQLSYNLYLRAETPHEVIVLFRDVRHERPFSSVEPEKLVGGHLKAEIKTFLDKNRDWRWGWAESIGWLLHLKGSVPHDLSFWQSIYEKISIPPRVRKGILEQVREGLSLSGWAEGMKH